MVIFFGFMKDFLGIQWPINILQGGAPVRERVQLVYKYYFTKVYGGYIYSYWDSKPTYNCGRFNGDLMAIQWWFNGDSMVI